MVDLVVSYARANRAMGERVVAGLARAGYDVAVDRDSAGHVRPIEEVAVEIREASVFIPLISNKYLNSPDARQTARIALLYDQRVVPVRLQADSDLEALASDLPVLVGTRYEDRPNDLADILAQAVDLSGHMLDGDYGSDFSPGIDDAIEPGGAAAPGATGPRRPRDPAIRPLLDELDRMSIAPRPPGAERVRMMSEEPVYDSYGFRKSTETMLARWRQIENDGSIRDFERFEHDYEDDPFFATLAAEYADNLRRRRTARIFDLGFRAVVGAIFAGMIVWASAAYCISNACGLPSRGAVASVPDRPVVSAADRAQLAAARRDAQRFKREAERLAQENGKLVAALKDAQNALARQASAPQPTTPTRPPVSGGGDLAEMRRLESELASANRALAQMRDEVRQRDVAINSLRSEITQRDRALQSRGQEISELQRQLASVSVRANAPGRQAVVAPVQRTSVGPGGPESGMERIMSFYRERFNTQSGRSGRFGEPVFTSQEIKMLQACLLKRTGRLSMVDGRWGRETTGALLGVTHQEAGWVIDCVLES